MKLVIDVKEGCPTCSVTISSNGAAVGKPGVQPETAQKRAAATVAAPPEFMSKLEKQRKYQREWARRRVAAKRESADRFPELKKKWKGEEG